jgi:hypothetical protein
VVLRGTLGSVSVNNQGTGAVYVVGATQRVDVNVGGVGTVVLDNANGESMLACCLDSVVQGEFVHYLNRVFFAMSNLLEVWCNLSNIHL